MKIYRGSCSAGRKVVTVDGNPLRMKRHPHDLRVAPFAWGERCVGAERLAFSMLADCLNDGYAVMLSVALMNDVISKLEAEWEITSDDIETWRAFRYEIGYSIQAAAWVARGLEPGGPAAEPLSIPPEWPRVVGNPNYRVSGNQAGRT